MLNIVTSKQQHGHTETGTEIFLLTTTSEHEKLECGPNIGGALHSMPQSLADAHY